ncbi:MAG TPA: ABC transporter permease [Steroidobacteraceae bacterium]|nr:ABC transporter permease [Steroidobacteraceae bacterium]
MDSTSSKWPAWRLQRDGEVAELHLTGDWIAGDSGVRSSEDVRHILEGAGGLPLRVYATGIGRWDSALIAFLKMLGDAAAAHRARPVELDTSALPDAARQLLKLAAIGTVAAAAIALARPTFLARVGASALALWPRTVAVAGLMGETTLRGTAALARRTCTRAADVLELMRDAGAGALGIVAVVNGLVGAIIAFVGAKELQRFGAGIYVADLVGVATVRELAAIVTAIVMAGRTGSAYAAHLATMQGNEEIDALNAFGIPVFDFLVLPRIAALITMMPLLYLYGCAVGIFGGFLVSIATLDITAVRFVEQLRDAMDLTELGIGITKSIAFGILVALTGCYIGLRAGRSAADVGRAATSAVVVAIVGIIALDAVFAVCTNALGI